MTSSTTGTKGGRRGFIAAVAATVVLVVVAAVALFLGFRGDGGRDTPPSPAAVSASSAGQTPADTTTPSSTPSAAPSTTAPTPTTAPTTAAPDAAFGDFLPAAQPTKIEIPSIGLSSDTFVELSVQKDGVLSVPGTEDEVGLYKDGPTPGQLGPSVIGAHVDSPEGRKGIFWNLGKVKAGDTIAVTRSDRKKATFTVDRVQAYQKTSFPTDLVYKGDFDRSEIRLVTCGGPVDSMNEYRDNVVVFGHLTDVSGA